MPKKKLLFVMPSLDAGGGEKALVNLLNMLALDAHYEIDLFLFREQGLFLDQLPANINIITPTVLYQRFTSPILSSIGQLLVRGNWNLVYSRCKYSSVIRQASNLATGEQLAWPYLSGSMKSITKTYDVAIGFLEKSSIYFTVDKVGAHKKIGWIHTTYSLSGLNPALDDPYFDKLDYIIGVSDQCAMDLKQVFPNFIHKITYIPNLVSKQFLKKASLQESITFDARLNILTVARLSEEKGMYLLVDTVKELRNRNINFCWYIIGDGPMKGYILQQIEQYDLQDCLKLLGLKSNPYPYIAACDLYCQPSKYEGKSIAIEEAKLLEKVIVVTDYPTVKDQMEHDISGIIVAQDAVLMADALINIDHNIQRQKKLMQYLSTYVGEEEIVKKEVLAIL